MKPFSFILLLFTLPAGAATLIEDFSYPAAGELRGKGTASDGWAGAWGAAGNGTGRILNQPGSNLSYSGGGYAIAQTGTGHAVGNYGTDFRGINRATDPLSGTVWFSFLVNNHDEGDRTGILLNYNGTASDYGPGTNYRISLAGDSVQVLHGTTTIADGTASTYALNATHLIVGSITFGAGNDALSIWVDPSDLANLSSITPNIQTAAIDIGDSLTKFGIFSYSATVGTTADHGQFDALRISDGDGDPALAFLNVTGVPEPAAPLFASLGMALAMFRRTNRKP